MVENSRKDACRLLLGKADFGDGPLQWQKDGYPRTHIVVTADRNNRDGMLRVGKALANVLQMLRNPADIYRPYAYGDPEADDLSLNPIDVVNDLTSVLRDRAITYGDHTSLLGCKKNADGTLETIDTIENDVIRRVKNHLRQDHVIVLKTTSQALKRAHGKAEKELLRLENVKVNGWISRSVDDLDLKFYDFPSIARLNAYSLILDRSDLAGVTSQWKPRMGNTRQRMILAPEDADDKKAKMAKMAMEALHVLNNPFELNGYIHKVTNPCHSLNNTAITLGRHTTLNACKVGADGQISDDDKIPIADNREGAKNEDMVAAVCDYLREGHVLVLDTTSNALRSASKDIADSLADVKWHIAEEPKRGVSVMADMSDFAADNPITVDRNDRKKYRRACIDDRHAHLKPKKDAMSLIGKLSEHINEQKQEARGGAALC